MPTVVGRITTRSNALPVIGLDYTPAYEQGGGIGRYVRELVAALARQNADNHYTLFVAGATSGQLQTPPRENFTWKPTRLTPRWLARIWHRAGIPLPIELFTGMVKLYHATDFVLPPTLPQTRTLLTVHDLSFVRTPETTPPSLKVYLDRVVPRSVNRSDLVLADSQATKDDLVSLYRVSPEKIVVLLSGVGAQFRRMADTEILAARNKYQLGGAPYILSVGTVQPRKNYIRLIQALAALRSWGYDLHLVIVGGRGWLDDPIYATLEVAHMQPFVHFAGFADEADLPALYSGAICVAFPSLYEGFGLPILEGMACGAPVVTSNISSLPEVAGDAALTINPYDVDALANALRILVDDSSLRQSLIDKGYTRAQTFSWDQSARQLLDIYAYLLG